MSSRAPEEKVAGGMASSSRGAKKPGGWSTFKIKTPGTAVFADLTRSKASGAGGSRSEGAAPEHKVYHTGKFLKQVGQLSGMHFMRSPKPELEPPDKPKPAAGSRSSKIWFLSRERAKREYRKAMAQPPSWTAAKRAASAKPDGTRPRLIKWDGQPDGDMDKSRFVLLRFDREGQFFECHGVQRYRFEKRNVAKSKLTEDQVADANRRFQAMLKGSTKEGRKVLIQMRQEDDDEKALDGEIEDPAAEDEDDELDVLLMETNDNSDEEREYMASRKRKALATSAPKLSQLSKTQRLIGELDAKKLRRMTNAEAAKALGKKSKAKIIKRQDVLLKMGGEETTLAEEQLDVDEFDGLFGSDDEGNKAAKGGGDDDDDSDDNDSDNDDSDNDDSDDDVINFSDDDKNKVSRKGAGSDDDGESDSDSSDSGSGSFKPADIKAVLRSELTGRLTLFEIAKALNEKGLLSAVGQGWQKALKEAVAKTCTERYDERKQKKVFVLNEVIRREERLEKARRKRDIARQQRKKAGRR